MEYKDGIITEATVFKVTVDQLSNQATQVQRQIDMLGLRLKDINSKIEFAKANGYVEQPK